MEENCIREQQQLGEKEGKYQAVKAKTCTKHKAKKTVAKKTVVSSVPAGASSAAYTLFDLGNKNASGNENAGAETTTHSQDSVAGTTVRVGRGAKDAHTTGTPKRDGHQTAPVTGLGNIAIGNKESEGNDKRRAYSMQDDAKMGKDDGNLFGSDYEDTFGGAEDFSTPCTTPIPSSL
jgi:hypothetical protein